MLAFVLDMNPCSFSAFAVPAGRLVRVIALAQHRHARHRHQGKYLHNGRTGKPVQGPFRARLDRDCALRGLLWSARDPTGGVRRHAAAFAFLPSRVGWRGLRLGSDALSGHRASPPGPFPASACSCGSIPAIPPPFAVMPRQASILSDRIRRPPGTPASPLTTSASSLPHEPCLSGAVATGPVSAEIEPEYCSGDPYQRRDDSGRRG
jgi:hypothetical protein